MLYAILNDDKKVINVIEHLPGWDLTDPIHIIKIIDPTSVGVGHTYDDVTGVFTPPKPYPSWILKETPLTPGKFEWMPPIDPPENRGQDDGNGNMYRYDWDESNQKWIPHIDD